jgi:hypothetical protein
MPSDECESHNGAKMNGEDNSNLNIGHEVQLLI